MVGAPPPLPVGAVAGAASVGAVAVASSMGAVAGASPLGGGALAGGAGAGAAGAAGAGAAGAVPAELMAPPAGLASLAPFAIHFLLSFSSLGSSGLASVFASSPMPAPCSAPWLLLSLLLQVLLCPAKLFLHLLFLPCQVLLFLPFLCFGSAGWAWWPWLGCSTLQLLDPLSHRFSHCFVEVLRIHTCRETFMLEFFDFVMGLYTAQQQ